MGDKVSTWARYRQAVAHTYAAYLRLSHVAGGRAADIPSQRRLITRWAAGSGITIVTWFVDASITASKSDVDRPEYSRLIQFIRDGHANSIVAVEPSRITRQAAQGAEVGDLLRQQRGVIAIPDRATYDLASNTGYGDWLGQFTDAVRESLQKSDRITRWHQDKLEDLDYAGGAPPYGWTKIVGIDSGQIVTSWEINPEQAEVIQEIADRVRSGEARTTICSDLNGVLPPSKGGRHYGNPIPAPRGALWSSETVNRLLSNPRLAGYRAVREKPPGSPGRGEWRILGKPDPAIAKRVFQPILTDEEWSDAVAALRRSSRRATTGAAVRHLLAGFVVCSECHAKMPNRDGTWHHANSASARKRTKFCLSPSSVRDRDLRPLVEELVSRRLASDTWRTKTPGEPALLAEVRRIEGQQAEIDAAVISGQMSAVHAGRLLRGIDDRLSEIHKQVAASRRADTVLDPVEAAAIWAAPLPADAADDVRREHLRARRVVLAELIERIEITPGLQGRGPFDPGRVDVVWKRHDGG